MAQDPSLRFGARIPSEVDKVYYRGLVWLAGAQSEDGTWKGGNQGAGVDGICLMAFLASGEDVNYGRYAGNVRRAVRGIIRQQNTTTGYLPASMYHHGFAMLALSEAYGMVDESLLWDGSAGEERIAPSPPRWTWRSAARSLPRRRAAGAAGATVRMRRMRTLP